MKTLFLIVLFSITTATACVVNADCDYPAVCIKNQGSPYGTCAAGYDEEVQKPKPNVYGGLIGSFMKGRELRKKIDREDDD